MEYFYLWVIGIGLLLAGIFTVRAALGYLQVRNDAYADYDYRAGQGMIDSRLSQDGYIRAYRRYNSPRSTAHIAGAFGGYFF